jgi:hypothetical protein
MKWGARMLAGSVWLQTGLSGGLTDGCYWRVTVNAVKTSDFVKYSQGTFNTQGGIYCIWLVS